MNTKKNANAAALAVTVEGNAILVEGEVILEVNDNDWGDPAAPILGALWMGAAINHYSAMTATLDAGRALTAIPLGSQERRQRVSELHTRTQATLDLLAHVAPVPPFAMPLHEEECDVQGRLEGSEVFGWTGWNDQVADYAVKVAPRVRRHILQAANLHLPLRQALCAQRWVCRTEIGDFAAADRYRADLVKFEAIPKEFMNAPDGKALTDALRVMVDGAFADSIAEWARVHAFWTATLPRHLPRADAA
jgi:hypothetical protein